MNIRISNLNINPLPIAFRKKSDSNPAFKTQQEPAKTISVYSDSPIRTNPAQLSLFALHDFHGQNLRMERAYTVVEKFDNDNIFKNNDFFEDDKPVDKLKLASGDMFLGENKKELMVVNEFLNLAGILATAIGNHECDTNLRAFAEIVKARDYKFLAANMHPDKGSAINMMLSNSFIAEKNGNKYGIIGLAPIDMASHIKRPYEIESCKLSDLDGTVKDVQREVDSLKKQGVNKIIVLSHMGLPCEQYIAKNVSDMVIFMADGVIEECGTPEEIFDNPKSQRLKEFLYSSLNK